MIYLLEFYATDSNIDKETSRIATLRNVANETSVQLTDVLRTKVVQCGNAYPEEGTKGIFIYSSSANIQSAIQMFWGCEEDAHLLKNLQCADTLLEETLQVPKQANVALYKSRGERGHPS